MKRLTALGIIGLSLTAGLGLTLTAAAFEEPIMTPPSGSIEAPLLAGGQAQIRTGPLTVQDDVLVGAGGQLVAKTGVTASDDLTVEGGSLCLKGVCVASWDDLGIGSLVRLNPTDPDFDVGQARVSGSLTVTAADGEDIGLYGRAATPQAVNADTAGLEGQSAVSVNDLYSYGVLGIGQNPNWATGSLAYGIYGSDAGNPNSYAGYFSGNVEVTANWGETGSPICLRTSSGQWDCRTAWPEATSADDLLKLQTVTPPVAQTGQTVVSGRGWFNTTLMGDTTGYNLLATCGDGVCANPETTVNCSADCPTLSSVSAVWTSATTAKFIWKANVDMTFIAVYGLTTTYGGLVQDTNFIPANTTYELPVSNLDRTKTYHYRVGGETRFGAMLFTADLQLRGAPAPEF